MTLYSNVLISQTTLLIFQGSFGTREKNVLTLFPRDHLQHLVSDVEAAKNIGDGQRDAATAQERAQGSAGKMGGRQRTQNDDPVERIHAGHQRRMQKTGNVAEHFIADDQSANKDQ